MPKKIIIVEDDESIQDVLKIILQGAGYQISTFTNGKEIIEDEYEKPDLFLLDKQLSGVDGLDLCLHLKSDEKTRNIPVIMISANPQIGSLAASAGADGYIEKPFSLEFLLNTIKSHIETKAENAIA